MNAVIPKTKEAMLPYVGFGVDDAAQPYTGDQVRRLIRYNPHAMTLDKMRFVGWCCGFEPMVVAVWSYINGAAMDEDMAVELAVDLLREKGWFADPENTEPDFVL